MGLCAVALVKTLNIALNLIGQLHIACVMGSCFLKSKNMFSYYGSKNKIAKLYPLPKYDLIIEPFAGAAWYSVLHRYKNVLLNEIGRAHV